MDINIILGVSLIIIVIYFVTLVFSIWRRNRQAELAPQWNSFRDQLCIQAQEDQVKAHRISISLQNQYKGLGTPYAVDRDQAIAILGRISDNSRTILNDRNKRTPIHSNTNPYSWSTLLIRPLWTEYHNRQDWWQTTQELGFKLSRNPSGFSAIEKLERRLDSKGEKTKDAFENLKNKTDELIHAFQSEARIPAQFQDQIQQLQQLVHQINQTIDTYLTGTQLSPKRVATAVPKLEEYQQKQKQLSQILKKSKDIRRNTRSQLEKNQTVIDTIEYLLRTEEEANRPIQTYREALNLEIKSKEEQERRRETGTYLQQPTQEQYGRLLELEKNLRMLNQDRLMLEERLTRGKREILLTETWINKIESPFVVDQTEIILEEVQKQQSMLDQLIHSSEDLDLLNSQIFIDPQKLASNRTIFDQSVITYKTLYQELYQEIPPKIQQMRAAIQNLQPLNVRYQEGLDLESLIDQTQALEGEWIATQDLPYIKESQIDQLIANLRQYERSLQEINSACQKAEDQYQVCSRDRADSQRIIEDQAFVELHQVMQVISREDQVSFSDQASDFAHQAEELNANLELINTDFAAATSDAADLLAKMKTLWGSYKQKYAVEKREYQALVDQLITLQSDFERYQVHELSIFRTQVSDPLIRIANWLQALPPQSIQALMVHNDDGYILQVEMERITKELSKENQNYTWAKEEADVVVLEAKSAIKKAEKELTKIPWGTQKPDQKAKASRERSPELEHSYRYLDSAEAAYKEITDPENEYQNSVEKAISDLGQQVRLNAKHAKEEAQVIYREIREQIDDIHQKCDNLEKTLADGEGCSMRLNDTGFRSQWGQIYRKYSNFEQELEGRASYREAFSYLEQALIESRYQIERMREFENSN